MIVMKDNPKPDIHFRASRDVYNYLVQVAKDQDRSLAYVVAGIVRHWIEANPTVEQAVAAASKLTSRRLSQ
jgi:hypothetical protein